MTVNELVLHNGKYDENYKSYEFVGYANSPIEKLRLLKGNGVDSTAFLRQAIFKVSDFENIGTALDSWFDLIERIPLANSAYQRILLDEDVNIITENIFLAAMQLVEGYASALSEKQEEFDEFQTHKSIIIENIDNEDDREFLTKHCNYSGETFRRLLKKFTFDSISKLESHSLSQFNKNYNKLIGKIKDERDIITHSSTCCTPQFDSIELVDIAVIYKYFYRINVLSKLGIPPDLICKRLSHSRSFVFYIKNFFNIDLKSPDIKLSEYDGHMRHFSQE